VASQSKPPPAEVYSTLGGSWSMISVAYCVGQMLVSETVRAYSFLVSNTGNVTLTDATVVEGAFTGTGAMSAVTCAPAAASLAPGASATCTATYVTTQADVDATLITNTATATGTPPVPADPDAPLTPKPVSDPSTATVRSTAPSALGLTKTALAVDVNGDGRIDAGDRVDWTLLVSNLGASTITAIAVTDPSGGAVTCPSTTLAPGASMTCTVASHTITAADAAAGTVANTATATGSGPGGAPLNSGPATASVPVVASPVLASTGLTMLPQMVVAGGALLILGLMLILAVARRRNEV
jgi:hypothetical protein